MQETNVFRRWPEAEGARSSLQSNARDSLPKLLTRHFPEGISQDKAGKGRARGRVMRAEGGKTGKK